MPGRHQQRADRYRSGPSEPAVRDDAAGDRGQIDEAGVEPENRRGERDRRQRATVGALNGRAERGESGNVLDVLRMQQLADQVQHQERLHAVVREPFPRFSEGKIGESAGMAHEGMVGLISRVRGGQDRAHA